MILAKARLVVNGNASSPFVAEDIRILSEDFDVAPVHCRGKRDIPKLVRALGTADVCLSWFVNAYARVAQTLCQRRGIPHVAIVGGYEVAGDPDLDYGTLAQRGVGGLLSRRFLYQVLVNADAVVVPSQFSRSELLGVRRPRRLEVIPLGVDLDKFRPLHKALAVGTLGETASPSQDVKGVGRFLATAAELPETDFHVVGAIRDSRVTDRAPANVTFHGHLDHIEVSRFLGGLRVYCQLSHRESFGLATVEAMAAGCIPVVTNRGALPEIVGDVGFMVPQGDGPGTAKAVRSALAMPSPHGPSRLRIQQQFSLELRRERLGILLNSLLAP